MITPRRRERARNGGEQEIHRFEEYPSVLSLNLP
jgi:hypothetical protein